MSVMYKRRASAGPAVFHYPTIYDSVPKNVFNEPHGEMLALEAALTESLGPDLLREVGNMLRTRPKTGAASGFRNHVREFVEGRPQRYAVLSTRALASIREIHAEHSAAACASFGFAQHNTLHHGHLLASTVQSPPDESRLRMDLSVNVGIITHRTAAEVKADLTGQHPKHEKHLLSAASDRLCILRMYFAWSSYLDSEILEQGTNLIMVVRKGGTPTFLSFRRDEGSSDKPPYLVDYGDVAPAGARLFFIPYKDYDLYKVW